MTIEIANAQHGKFASSATITCEKTSAYISIAKDGRINVCTLNAAHRVWRGAGKFFANMSEAMDAYKSSAMKAILETAQTELIAQ